MMQSKARHTISCDYFLKLLDDPDFQREFLLSHLSRSYDRSIKKLINIAQREFGIDPDSIERQRIARRFQMRLSILESEKRVERKANGWRLK